MILAIDIGATFIKTGLFNTYQKKFIDYKIFSTPKTTKSFFKILNKIIIDFKNSSIFNKIGIGFPGNIDINGNILFSPNLKFLENKNFLEKLPNNFIIKIENDANCAAIGEFKFGGFNVKNDLLCITIGTGIGGGIIINKKLFQNSRKIGMELGHTIVIENGEKCSCGKFGCLEAYSSASGMLKRFKHKNIKTFEQLLKQSIHDKNAKKILEEGFYYLGCGVSNFINIFSPEIIILSGGVAKAFKFYKKEFIRGIKKHTIKFLQNKVIIKQSKIKQSGLYGAAGLF